MLTGSRGPSQTDQNGNLPQPCFRESTCSWGHFQWTCLQAGCQLNCQLSSVGSQTPGNSHRCFYNELVQCHEAVYQSTMELNRQSPISDTQPEGSRISSSGTSLEFPTMVPSITSEAGQRTTSHSSVTRNNTASMPERPPRHFTPVSHVGCIRNRCQSGHLSETATNLILSSWRDKSSRSYNSSFSKWARWCQQRDRNPVSGPISDIANFLAELYQEGYQYSSINVYCSSISMTQDKVDGYLAGQHPTVVRPMKGVFNKRPPLPRYTHSWDVSKVTSYISSLDVNDNLSLKILSLKLVMLLALTRPTRSSDLSSLDFKIFEAFTQWNPVLSFRVS